MTSNSYQAIPTMYGGRQYRSRLEARWASFFDLLGWRYEYEPFDLKGWIPDFLLLGGFPGPVLVEVKPVTSHPDWLMNEIDACSGANDYEILIAGCVIPVPTEPDIELADGLAIGWMRGCPMSWSDVKEPLWGSAMIQAFYRKDFVWNDQEQDYEESGWRFDSHGLFCSQDSKLYCDPGYVPIPDELHIFAHNRFGHGTCLNFWESASYAIDASGYPTNRVVGPVVDMWAKAGNRSQWKPPQNR